MKSKILKYSILFLLFLIIIVGIYYLKLSNRHKAIVKTRIFHELGLVDNTWNVQSGTNGISLITPTLVIDNVYKSMEGPKAFSAFQLNAAKNDLVWITSFETKALRTNEVNQLSNDYICHTNLDFYDGEHYSRWQLNDRVGKGYPRLTSLSNGMERYAFPEGFGFPAFTNENLFLSTQTLNHNIKTEPFSVKHEVNIGFKEHDTFMKPLMSKTVFVMLPYDAKNPFDESTETNPNMCLPVETKNHSYRDKEGQHLSGHWVVFPGASNYNYNITHQLQLKDSTTMHFIATHLHPFASSLAFRDKTLDSTLFFSEAINHSDKIGPKEVAYFSSELGIMLYPDHEYELVLAVNNTSKKNQDMMASMFVFLYDKQMAEKLKTYNPIQ